MVDFVTVLIALAASPVYAAIFWVVSTVLAGLGCWAVYKHL
jgi:hypothetical protein